MRVRGDTKRMARPMPNATQTNIIELYKHVSASRSRLYQYEHLVNGLNQYLRNRYRCKTNPIEVQKNFTLDANRSAFRLYLRFKPGNARYTLVVANATFGQKNINGLNVLSETCALFEFLVQQSEKCRFNTLKLERYCGIPEQFIEMYLFNRIDGEAGWQITTEELREAMSKSSLA